MNETTGKRWYVVQTQAGKEDLARLHLDRQRFGVWCPKILRTARSGRQIRTRLRPLFPGYLFVELTQNLTTWRSIDGTYGVVRILKNGTQPARLPDGFVEALQHAVGQGGGVGFSDPLNTGDRVRILSGAFDDWIGTVIALPDRERVTLLLDMIGRAVPVTISRSDVIRAA